MWLVRPEMWGISDNFNEYMFFNKLRFVKNCLFQLKLKQDLISCNAHIDITTTIFHTFGFLFLMKDKKLSSVSTIGL